MNEDTKPSQLDSRRSETGESTMPDHSEAAQVSHGLFKAPQGGVSGGGEKLEHKRALVSGI